MMASIQPVPLGRPSFLGSPRRDDLQAVEADVAVLGIPYTTPVDLTASRSPSSPAPAAFREQSLRFAESLRPFDTAQDRLFDSAQDRPFDFEFGGDLFAGRQVAVVDCGDIAGRPGRYEENSSAATEAVRTLVERGSLPLLLGGDQAATIPALRAYAGLGPICVVHLGAELCWRDEVNGVREAAPSAMRRVSELPWVSSMLQIGLRGAGSARAEDVKTAGGAGSVLVTAAEVHREGVEVALEVLPGERSYYVSLNLGALDPAIAPGVSSPAFGGLSYFEATDLLKGVAARGPIVGVDLAGVVPAADVNGITSLLGVRLALNVLGALAHAGRLGTAAAATSAAGPTRHTTRFAMPTAPRRGVGIR